MKRTIIKIDEEKCNGCGSCVSGCHEGALQLIDGKARMVSELFCDGLGACIGECPVGAIELEEREAEPYNEMAVMERISPKGEKTVLAHLRHLKDHGEMEYFKQGVQYIRERNLPFDLTDLRNEVHSENHGGHAGSGCPGSRMVDLRESKSAVESTEIKRASSELRQWPIQLHLLSPMAGYFKNADVLLASDCSAFAMGSFHSEMLKGKTLAIACPKLDSNKESYVEKLKIMFDEAKINTLTIVMMEVPCCGGLLQMAKMAQQMANRKVPVKAVYLSIQGEIISEDWV